MDLRHSSHLGYEIGEARWQAPSLLRAKSSPQYALSYGKYDIEDLRTFITDRTGKAPDIAAGKLLLCRKLKALDRSATFRFLDLPTQIRHMVYLELLHENKVPYEPMYTQILGTSKEVNNEAAGIAYKRCSIGLECSRRERNGKWRLYIMQTITSARGHSKDLLTTDMSASKIARHYPLFALRHAKTIQISIPRIPDPLSRRLNHVLYALVSQISGARSLKRLVLVLPKGDRTIPWKEIFYPLSRLDRRVRLIFIRMPKHCRKYIFERRARSTEPCDILDQARVVKRKARHVRADLRRGGSSDARLEQLERELEAKEQNLDYIDERTDAFFTESIRALSAYVDGMRLPQAG